MPATPLIRPRLVALTGLPLIAATLVAALLAMTGAAAAQPAALITSLTATHGSLEPGALITYTVTITNPDVVDRTTNEFVFLDAGLTVVPA